MSINHTKSNTMVNITKSTLNNKKSTLKYCFIKELGFDIESVKRFDTGENVNIKDSILDKKEIDIIGLDKDNNPIALIEIKVNVFEKLQDSQSQGSNYQNYAKAKQIPIYYIVPQNYSHLKEIGTDEYVTVKTWNEILERTTEYDTVYSDAIRNNVENIQCTYSSENKAFMARVWEVLCRMHIEIDFSKENVMGNYSESEDFGNWVYTKKDFGIGFYSDGVWLWYEITNQNIEKYKTIGFEPYGEIHGFVWKKIMDLEQFKNENIETVSRYLKSNYDESLENIKAIE